MTLDEARLMANVNARAERLFEDGYRAHWENGQVLVIRNARGMTYHVDTQAQTCTCPFYRVWDGHHPCKHLLGYNSLLARQQTLRNLIALLLLLAWRDLDDHPGKLSAYGLSCGDGDQAPEP